MDMPRPSIPMVATPVPTPPKRPEVTVKPSGFGPRYAPAWPESAPQPRLVVIAVWPNRGRQLTPVNMRLPHQLYVADMARIAAEHNSPTVVFLPVTWEGASVAWPEVTP